MAEELTDEERRWLSGESAMDPGPTVCAKALRIIDELTRERDEAWSEVSRAQQVGLKLESEVARLQAELALESDLVTLHAGGASRAEFRVQQLEHDASDLRTRIAELEAVLDQESRSKLEAMAELRRLGHGVEDIDVICADGLRFLSRVGDISWDTAENRARVRAHHAASDAKVEELQLEVDRLNAVLEAKTIQHADCHSRLRLREQVDADQS